jgi:hypothetical protein
VLKGQRESSEGCRLCAMRMENLDVDSFETLGESLNMVVQYSPLKIFKAPKEGEFANWQCFQVCSIKKGDFVPISSRRFVVPLLSMMASVNTYSGDPVASLITKRPPLTDLSSQGAFTQIWKWIDECTKNHGSPCQNAMPRPPPHEIHRCWNLPYRTLPSLPSLRKTWKIRCLVLLLGK